MKTNIIVDRNADRRAAENIVYGIAGWLEIGRGPERLKNVIKPISHVRN